MYRQALTNSMRQYGITSAGLLSQSALTRAKTQAAIALQTNGIDPIIVKSRRKQNVKEAVRIIEEMKTAAYSTVMVSMTSFEEGHPLCENVKQSLAVYSTTELHNQSALAGSLDVAPLENYLNSIKSKDIVKIKSDCNHINFQAIHSSEFKKDYEFSDESNVVREKKYVLKVVRSDMEKLYPDSDISVTEVHHTCAERSGNLISISFIIGIDISKTDKKSSSQAQNLFDQFFES